MSAPAPVDLAGLLAERDRVEAWLGALEGRRETTPPAVFEKVQRDYSARLELLVGQLRERDRELELRVAKHADELAGIEATQRAKQEARSEAELRHVVGEFTEAQWVEVSKSSDAELGAIESRRVDCARDYQAALDLLASVRRPAGADAMPAPSVAASTPGGSAVVPPPQRGATPARGSAQLPMPTSLPVAPARATPTHPGPAARPSDSGHQIKTPASDELAFLSSLAADVARRSGMSRAVPVESAAEPTAPAPLLAPRQSRPVAVETTAPAPRQSRPLTLEPSAPSAPPARRASVPVQAPPPVEDSGMPAEQAGLTDADVNVPRGSHQFNTAVPPRATAPRVTSRDSASILRRAQGDQAKSLKCSECATMNLPTEWYCEKCGAELSAL